MTVSEASKRSSLDERTSEIFGRTHYVEEVEEEDGLTASSRRRSLDGFMDVLEEEGLSRLGGKRASLKCASGVGGKRNSLDEYIAEVIGADTLVRRNSLDQRIA